MKIEHALVLYLLKNKQISLQGIGAFTLDMVLPEVTDNDKPIIIPANAVSFQYEPKTGEDETIVDFIVEHTKKIKPLASADLDSFLTLGRQFLNIGKPFTIQNLGTLEKLKSGELSFKPGQLILQKIEAPKDITENDVEENDTENLFNDYQGKDSGNSGRKTFLIIVVLLILGIGGWAAWSYLSKKNDRLSTTSDNIIPIIDSSSVNNDTLAENTVLTDSTKFSVKTLSDSASFNFIIKETTNRQAALERFTKLKRYGRNVVMYTNDSITYKVAEPFFLPLSDTTWVIDSLDKYYMLSNAQIEMR